MCIRILAIRILFETPRQLSAISCRQCLSKLDLKFSLDHATLSLPTLDTTRTETISTLLSLYVLNFTPGWDWRGSVS